MVSIRKPAKRSIVAGGLAVALTVGIQVAVLAPAATAAVTLNVTTTADIAANAGACGNSAILTPPNPANLSLREAACLANNNGGTSTINVPSGTYTLTSGELVVGTASGQNVTINGAGSGSTTISGNNAHRVLDFDPNTVGGVAGTVNGVTITAGNDSGFGGAGIIAGSVAATTTDSLTVTNSIITNNAANTAAPDSTVVPGGGIQLIGGSLTISNSVISNNSSRSSSGAGVYYSAYGAASSESLTISNTTFSGNTMTNTNGTFGTNNGGALDVHGQSDTQFHVSNSTFTDNSVAATSGGADGGALHQDNGVLTVTGSTFTGNSVSGGQTAASGGAIAVTNGTTTLHYNRFVGNIAAFGQALHAEAGADTVSATENWFGCNGGPGTSGCDSVVADPPATISVSPRLTFTASAGSASLTGPNATTPITGGFTTDSAGASVDGTNLGAFTGKPVTFTDPQPAPATVSASSQQIAPNSGTATVTYDSKSSSGPGHVVAGFDNASVTVAVTVNRPPAVTVDPADQSVQAGDTATFTAAANGYPAPTVQWQRSTGGSYTDISGATSPTYSFTAAQGDSGSSYRAVFTNSVGTATTAAATLGVGAAPAFTSANTATFVAGTPGSFTVTTSGTPTVTTISRSGSLPTGLTFTDKGNGTATIAGTPAAGTGGTYPLTLTATNGVAPDATQNLTVQVNQAPAVTASPSDQTVNPGTSVSFEAGASGVPTPTVQWQRSTNGGSTYTDVAGATSTTYTFTAAAGDDGNRYRAVFTNVVDSATSTAATLHVGTAPAFTSANTTTFTVGAAGSFAVTTSGVPNAAISSGGTAPAWVTLTDHGDGTATLAGTPPAGSGGPHVFTLRAANGFSPSATQTFTLNVDEAPTITSTDHATFVVGSAGSFAVTTTAGFPTTTAISETGALPSGVTFADKGDGTATLAGTPAAGSSGVYPIVVHADAVGGTTSPANQSFTVTVAGPPLITSADHTTFTVGTAGNFTVTTSAGNPAPTTISRTGTLPSGVTFVDEGNGTATLSGTPAAGTGGSYALTITASNGVGPDPVQTFTLTVDQPPRITSANQATFVKGAASAFTVTTAPGVPASTTVTETGALPGGISFTDEGDGTATLGGTPTTSGVFPITIKAGNGIAPDASQSFTLTVTTPPTITSADHATFTAGTAGTFTVTTAAGTPSARTITRTGTLPSGVTFTDHGDGTATLAGTPASGTGGSYLLTLTAANGVKPDATQSFTLTVLEPSTITSADHVTFTKNASSSSFTVTTAGGFPTPPAVTESGALPPGTTFVDNGDGTATLSGTPTAGGAYPFTITAANGVAPNATQSFTATVNDAPAITSADHTTFAVGTSGSFTVTTTAGTPATTTLTSAGTLPSGVTFTDNGNGTATLTGTPAAGTGGVYPLTITAANTAAHSTQSFTLTVTQRPAVSSADHTTFSVGTAGSFDVTATAGFPSATTLTRTGALPSGVTFTDHGDGTATLAGTPAAGTGGTYPITITAANSAGHTDQSFTLTVREAPGITSADHTTFTVGTGGTFTVTTGAGFPTPPTLTSAGALPDGVTFADNGDGTATLTGTPAAGTGGTYPLSITAANGVDPDDTQSFTLTVDQPPAVTSADHATFTIATSASVTVTTSGFPHPALTEVGALPTGVTFHDNGDGTATLAGTPAAGTNGAYPLTITAGNGVGAAAVQSFTLTVVKASQTITVTSTPPANPVVGGSYTPTATTDSGLTVAFSIDGATTNSACSLSGGTVHFEHAGSCIVDADQSGDSTYQAAPRVQQTLTVAAIGTAVSVASSTSPTVFGQAAHATATVTAASGAPAGSVQFAVDGSNLGGPVTVSGGAAVSPDLTDSTGHPLAPGSHPVTATFTPSDPSTYAGSSNSVTQVVNKAATTTVVTVQPSTITAAVAPVAPGAGTPTGSVAFSVAGTAVGTADLVNGVATLHRVVPPGKTRQVGASYGGDGNFTGSSNSTARHDPRTTAHVSSTHARTRYGWYRGTVTITFTCATNGAPLTKPCPSAVHLTRNGAGQSVTRTITATDGGMETVVVSTINIDHTKPRVRVAGVRNGATYASAPKLTCVAGDALSGIAACKLTKHTSGGTTSYRATATDKAGNASTVTGRYHTQAISLLGAKFVDGAYNVKLGHSYTLVVHSIRRPTYYDAAPVPTTPFKRDQAFFAAGTHRWALGVTVERKLHHYRYWNIGVKIGSTMHVIRIRVS